MTELVKISCNAGVADVRLARPEKLNALDPPMFNAIAAAIAGLAEMPGLRCVVLSGEGRAFCAGVDLVSLAGDPILADLRLRTHGQANLFQAVAWGWRKLPVPVIAAVHGVVFGAGVQIMLGADIRIAKADAEFSMMETRWGLVPDMAGIALLRGLVRDDIAREMIFTARRVSGTEAAAFGLVTRLAADPLAEALALAEQIAAMSPAAVRAAKRLLNTDLNASAAEILQAEAVEQAGLLKSPEHKETLAAAREKRPPIFAD